MRYRALEEVAGRIERKHVPFSDLMPWRVRRILLVSSLYDSFTFQEDGNLGEMLFTEYQELNLSSAPTIIRVSTAEDAVRELPDANPDLEYVIGHPRHMDASLPYISGVVSGQGWAITRQSENKQAALTWVKFMIKPENIGLYNTLAGTTPVGNMAKRYWKPNPCVLEHVNRFSPYLFSDQDANTLWQESKVVCGPHFQAAVLGEATVEEALENITNELDAILAEKYG